ncbi:MAG: hypothetical protein EB072_00005, partial [Betaproteobacteria bacterium]|nr:hypothetical protein [Betaproteobacteria bacterium]
IHVRGPIVRVETATGRLRQSAENKQDVVLVPDGDLILSLESAIRLHEALGALIQQLKERGVLQERPKSQPEQIVIPPAP